MNFKQIEAFRAVILSGSMTAAARELNTSQPNVSRLIAQLERQIGFKLFARLSGRLLPTPEAHAFFRDVGRAFTGMDSLEKSAHAIAALGTGHLRVGTVPSMLLTLIPEAAQAFSHEFPDVSITIHTSDSTTVGQWTASGFCDIGVTSYNTGGAGVSTQTIRRMDGVCILPGDHRLARGDGPIGPDDLRGEKFLSLLEGDGTRRNIDAGFRADGPDPRVLTYSCQYAAAICTMVAKGMGVSVVHPAVAQSHLHTGLAVRPFRPQISFFTFLLRPLQYPCGRLAERFGEIFSAALNAVVPPAG